MFDNEFKYNFGDFEILVVTKKTSKGYFGKGYCPDPECVEIFEAADYINQGHKHIADIVYMRIKSHMIGEHNIKDKN